MGQRVTVDAARFDPFTGRFSVTGFAVTDREGVPFATFDRLEGRLHRRSLFRGHVWIHELALRNSAVRVVRYGSGEFNIADFIKRGEKSQGTTLDVTVDHFSLDGGLVTLEDRILMLTPPEHGAKTLESLDTFLFSEKAYLRDATGELALSLLAGPATAATIERLTGVVLPDRPWSHVTARLGDVDDEAVVAAARLAGADQLLCGFPVCLVLLP
jgi:hypothetical protein